MATLTQSQIQVVAVTAGLPNPKLMAAIAMAESSGRTDVVNGIGAVGLWQINQPVHVVAHPTWTVAYLKNPVNNAMAAKVILNSQGFGAWEGYTNGAYKKYLDSATVQAVDENPCQFLVGPALEACKRAEAKRKGEQVDPQNPRPPSEMGLDDISEMLGVAGKGAQWISNPVNWIRIAYVVGGGALAVVGLNMLTRNALFSSLPVGKIAKMAKGVK